MKHNLLIYIIKCWLTSAIASPFLVLLIDKIIAFDILEHYSINYWYEFVAFAVVAGLIILLPTYILLYLINKFISPETKYPIVITALMAIYLTFNIALGNGTVLLEVIIGYTVITFLALIIYPYENPKDSS